MFGALRPRLVALRERILGADARQPAARPASSTRRRSCACRASWRAPSATTSPTGGSTRRCTRSRRARGSTCGSPRAPNPRDPFNCFYSTIHEVGHAAYEQGIDRAFLLTPLGRGVSMGVHESQSRIYENQLGRSRAFTGLPLQPDARRPSATSASRMPRPSTPAVNRVRPGYIRTEADEVHYNLHVLMRFDLERALIAGRLERRGPARGLERPLRGATSASRSTSRRTASCRTCTGRSGLFGYFPTYTLGNVYAGCLHEALRAAVPDLDAQLARGRHRAPPPAGCARTCSGTAAATSRARSSRGPAARRRPSGRCSTTSRPSSARSTPDLPLIRGPRRGGAFPGRRRCPRRCRRPACCAP